LLRKLAIRPNQPDLLKSVEELSTNAEGTAPVIEVLLIDGAVLVNMLKLNGVCKTFSDYVDLVYLPYVRNQL